MFITHNKAYCQSRARKYLLQKIRRRSIALAKKRYHKMMQNRLNIENMHSSKLQEEKYLFTDLNTFQFVFSFSARHTTPYLDELYDVQPCYARITLPDSSTIYAHKEGKLLVKFHSDQGEVYHIILSKVFFVPDLPNRLFSTQRFLDGEPNSVQVFHDAIVLKFYEGLTYTIKKNTNRRQTFHRANTRNFDRVHDPQIEKDKVVRKSSEMKEDTRVMTAIKEVNEESKSTVLNSGYSLVAQQTNNKKISQQRKVVNEYSFRKAISSGLPPYKRISSAVEGQGNTSFVERSSQISSKTCENHAQIAVKSKSSPPAHASVNQRRSNDAASLQRKSLSSFTAKRTIYNNTLDLHSSTTKPQEALPPGWTKHWSKGRNIPYYVNALKNKKYWTVKEIYLNE